MMAPIYGEDIRLLILLSVLVGCSPVGDADKSSARPRNEMQAYGAVFRATGAQFWIDHPEQILDRPDDAFKALSSAKKITVDHEKLLTVSRQGPYIVRENERRVGQLIEVACFARQKRLDEARAALDKYRNDLEDAWPNCWRKGRNDDEAK